MKLEAFIFSLRKGIRSGIKDQSRYFLYKRDKTILALLRDHSPVDSGNFNSNWKVKRVRFGNQNVLAGLAITNDTPNYGKFVAFGAEPGKAPWYYPNRNKKGQFVKGTGKLKKSGGKVWAGGLNPGHDKTVGGPIVQVMDKFANKFAQEFGDKIAKDLM